MKKATFTIATRDGFKDMNGYIETIGALTYGFHKNGNRWVITEILSGLKVADCATRKAAVKKAEDVHEIIFNAVQNNKSTKKRIKAMQDYKKAQKGEKEMRQTKKRAKGQAVGVCEHSEVVEWKNVVKVKNRASIKRLEKAEKNATWTRNEEKHGIEISFKEKPEKSIRDMLKSAGFRWHNAKKIWYAKETDARLKVANAVC